MDNVFASDAAASPGNIMNEPREYLKLKYMGSCKCGDCQLVPAATLALWQEQMDRLQEAARRPEWRDAMSERCPSCFGTDADYALGAYRCSNPWHADDHLRAKTLARQTTASGLPHREGQAVECDGGLHSPQEAK